jgi:hypothetical protein
VSVPSVLRGPRVPGGCCGAAADLRHFRCRWGSERALGLLRCGLRRSTSSFQLWPCESRPIVKAIRYALSRWEGLPFFAGDGGMELLETPLS